MVDSNPACSCHWFEIVPSTLTGVTRLKICARCDWIEEAAELDNYNLRDIPLNEETQAKIREISAMQPNVTSPKRKVRFSDLQPVATSEVAPKKPKVAAVRRQIQTTQDQFTPQEFICRSRIPGWWAKSTDTWTFRKGPDEVEVDDVKKPINRRLATRKMPLLTIPNCYCQMCQQPITCVIDMLEVVHTCGHITLAHLGCVVCRPDTIPKCSEEDCDAEKCSVQWWLTKHLADLKEDLEAANEDAQDTSEDESDEDAEESFDSDESEDPTYQDQEKQQWDPEVVPRRIMNYPGFIKLMIKALPECMVNAKSRQYSLADGRRAQSRAINLTGDACHAKACGHKIGPSSQCTMKACHKRMDETEIANFAMYHFYHVAAVCIFGWPITDTEHSILPFIATSKAARKYMTDVCMKPFKYHDEILKCEIRV